MLQQLKIPYILLALSLVFITVGCSSDSTGNDQSSEEFSANLMALNNSGSSGTATLKLNDDQLTVKINAKDLAARVPVKVLPDELVQEVKDKMLMEDLNYNKEKGTIDFPHVQHIHGLGKGKCPTMAVDKKANGGDNNGVIETLEAGSSYGMIQTTFTSGDSKTGPDQGLDPLKAPALGSTENYSRTFSVNADTKKALQNGNGVIVIHGVAPSAIGADVAVQKSDLPTDLPIAATAPALCGEVTLQ